MKGVLIKGQREVIWTFLFFLSLLLYGGGIFSLLFFYFGPSLDVLTLPANPGICF